MVERQDVEEVKGVLERRHKRDSIFVLQKANGTYMDLDRIRYLELRADGHVVAKVLLHLINLLSVGFHDRRQ